MVGYTLAGIQPDDGGWTSGDEKKAQFKTNLDIFNTDGSKVQYNGVQEGSPTWNFVPMGSTLKYQVYTGKSDRVQLQLVYFDIKGLYKKVDEVLNSLSESELQSLAEGTGDMENLIFERAVEKMGGWNNVYITVWSNVVNTNSNGTFEGTVTLNPNWEKSGYMFLAHYGYDADAESQGDAYASVIWDSVSIGLMLASLALLPFPGGAALTAAVWYANLAALCIDAVILGKIYQAQKFGVATVNKHDEKFPTYGFNHIYSFNTMDEEGAEETSGEVSQENQQIVNDLRTINDINDVAKLSVFMLATIVALKLLKQRRNG